MVGNADGQIQTVEIDPNSPDARIFVQESQRLIATELNSLYANYRRDPMRILRTLSIMVGRAIYVRTDVNASSPYVTLADGALSLRVNPKISAQDVEKYKAMIEQLIKPALIELIKKLDRVVQDEMLTDLKKGLAALTAARANFPSVDFDPFDERFSGVLQEESVEPESVCKSSGDSVRNLLDSVFNK